MVSLGHPNKRTDGLVVQDLDGEVLLYDLERHEAHCLNPAAGAVWRGCDGTRSHAELAALLPGGLAPAAAAAAVEAALVELGRLNLLEEAPAGGRMSRGTFVKRFGIAAAAAMPVVTSLVAPEPAAAASCGGSGAPCVTGADCCSNSCLPVANTCV